MPRRRVPGVRVESPYRGVVGTVTATPCDERCFYAEGPQCSCSCGGINHGKGHHSAGILFAFSRRVLAVYYTAA